MRPFQYSLRPFSSAMLRLHSKLPVFITADVNPFERPVQSGTSKDKCGIDVATEYRKRLAVSTTVSDHRTFV